MRIASLRRPLLVVGLWHVHLHVHLTHHPLKGPPVDYAGLALATLASWVGLPGPGESVLIAAGILAAAHKLDIVSVLVVAFVAATAGGVAGWLIGLAAGRAILVAPGPLHRWRRRMLARGDEVFGRYTVMAVVLTPTWLAGIHRVRPRVYLPLNVLQAAVWAGGIGLGAYYVGPSVVDLVNDLGWVSGGGLVVLALVAVGAQLWRRRRRAAQQAL